MSAFKILEVLFRAILIQDIRNNTLYIIAFSSSMEIFLFDGTIYICVEVNQCKNIEP